MMNVSIISSLDKKLLSYHDISLRLLCKEDLAQLALSLRRQDRSEIWAAYRLPVEDVLEKCYQKSSIALALFYRGKICGAAGVEADSLLGARGCVWSWTGKGVEQSPKKFWQVSKEVLRYFLSIYPQLYALCDVRYRQAQRYLLRLGACKQEGKIHLAGKETVFELYQFQRPC